MVESQKLPGVDLGATAEPRVVRLFVKAPWQEEEFLVHKDMSVQEFKEHVARHFSSSPDHVVLVSAGRILRDHRTLGQHGVHLDDDATVHVVVRSQGARPSRQVSAAPNSAAFDQKSLRSGTLASDDLRGLTASLGLNTDNFSAFQSQLMSNPEMMLQLLENPFIQSRLSSPNLMKELVTSNPKVQQVIQKAPEISHVFGSPEGVRLVVELARNPAAVREFIKSPPQAVGCPGSVPAGDNSSALQEALTEVQGLMQRAIPRLLGSGVLPGPLGGHQPCFEQSEKIGQAKEKTPSPRLWPLKAPSQNLAAGAHDLGRGESGTLRGEAGQLASVAVKNLLHQIIKHLMQNLGGSPPRSSPPPERGGRRSRRNARGPEMLQVPVLLQQIQNTDVLLASWSPREIQGLLEIQQRLQALAADEPQAERRGRAQRPARKARSITSLCDLVSPASSAGDFPAQQILRSLGGTDLPAGIKCASCLRGSSAQPSSKQKRAYKV